LEGPAFVSAVVPTATPTPGAAKRPFSVRRWLLAVALIACAHGMVWSVLTPPFQAPDETEHFAYAQYLAETGKLPPRVGSPQYSAEELAAFAALGTTAITGNYFGRTPATETIARGAESTIEDAESLPRDDGGGPSTASSQPPLAYLLWAVPYHVGAATDGSILTRLWLMRLLSVLCFVATAVGCALVARELLPSWSWAGPIAGVLVALQPVLAFISVSVNPDTLLFAVSTWALLVAVRILKHGLTTQRAIGLGALTAAGLVTKLTFLGLVPGLALALLIGLARSREGRARNFALATAAAASLPAAFVLWGTVQGRGLWPVGGGTTILPPEQQAPATLGGLLSHGWQLFLPRAPSMQDSFGYFPPYEIWIKGFIARLGWLDYGVRGWIYEVGALILVGVLILLVVALARAGRVRRHYAELAVFGLCALGLAAQITYAGYDYRRLTGFGFEQTRYLFPLIALYGTGVVAAATALGRRVAPALAAALVGVAALHVLAVVFATVARYYG
jgi:4-amino-4-deoxy-L-arabinose transferase-like glycosyltransferase